MSNNERFLSFSEVIAIIQPRMPGKNAAALLLADGFGKPPIVWVEREGRRVYPLSEVAAFSARVLMQPLNLEHARHPEFVRRSGRDRRLRADRRRMQVGKLSASNERRSHSERRVVADRRSEN